MITVKVIVNNSCKDEMVSKIKLPSPSFEEDPSRYSLEFKNADSKHFYTARDAKKVINDYAVTKLPFVLLIDDTLPEDQQEYAAVYSEEGPITIDRINAKL